MNIKRGKLERNFYIKSLGIKSWLLFLTGDGVTFCGVPQADVPRLHIRMTSPQSNKQWADLGAAIAQWIRLRLPFCRPRFESQAHHLRFFKRYSFKLYSCHINWNVKRKRARLLLREQQKCF